jgi:hypothetical protein
MNRADIINELITRNNYTSYLEIGLGDGKNYNRILCQDKCGIDPKEVNVDRSGFESIFRGCSQQFFHINTRSYDVIFIDGDHKSEQVYLDLTNALDCITVGGTIVMHDCLPKTFKMQQVPRIQSEWTGDVWKVFAGFKAVNHGYVIDTDYGCGIIHCDSMDYNEFEISDLSYKEMVANKDEILGLVSVKQFLEKLE